MLKFATLAIIEAKTARLGGGLMKDAHRASFEYEPQPGFLYVRSRAISSRCNDNYDEFPAEEIKQAYGSFVGKPVFVNHRNENHKRARGVIVAAVLHEDTNPDGSPDTWVEVLMEVDAINFPKLAEAIIKGEIDRTSMGCDVAYSKCSFCGNKAVTPLEYCAHVKRNKGQRIRRRNAANGQSEDVLVREICYGLRFFENSLLVEEPADPTAFFLGVDTRGLSMTASKTPCLGCGDDEVPAFRLAVEQMNLSEMPTMIDRLAGVVSDAIKGSGPTVIDLCQVHVTGTNLFCQDSKSIPRHKMPQLTGEGGLDLGAMFAQEMMDKGFEVTHEVVPAASLRASQSEINAKKVGSMVETMQKGGTFGGMGKRLFVSGDDYIVDGHHRWAAMVAYDMLDSDLGDVRSEIVRIHTGILDVIELANEFAARHGSAPKSFAASLTAQSMAGNIWRTSTGVVHKSLMCPRIGWSSNLSVIPVESVAEDHIVASFGEKACSVCFRSAPVHRPITRSANVKKKAVVTSVDGKPAPDLGIVWKLYPNDDTDPNYTSEFWTVRLTGPEPINVIEAFVHNHTAFGDPDFSWEADGTSTWGAEFSASGSTVTAAEAKQQAEIAIRDSFDAWWAKFDSTPPESSGPPSLPWHRRSSKRPLTHLSKYRVAPDGR